MRDDRFRRAAAQCARLHPNRHDTPRAWATYLHDLAEWLGESHSEYRNIRTHAALYFEVARETEASR